MAQKDLTDLYAHIIPYLPGRCGKAIVLQQIRATIRDFCEKTLRWEEDIDPMDIEADVSRYELDPPLEYTDIEAVTKVVQDNRELNPETEYTQSNDKQTIILDTEPGSDSADALEVTVALKPTLDAVDVPEEFWNDWHKIWSAGAMAALMDQPNKVWSDAAAAQKQEFRYDYGIAIARSQAIRQRTIRPLRGRPKHSWV